MLTLGFSGRILVAVESVDGRKASTRSPAWAEAVIAELRGVVAELRKQVEAQQAHIHRLVKITFGRGGERVEGPTLFDGLDMPEAEVLTPVEPPAPEAPAATKRKGHGRRCKPKDLPRRREEIDLSDAEKVCACCGTAKIRIGQMHQRTPRLPADGDLRPRTGPPHLCLPVVRIAGP